MSSLHRIQWIDGSIRAGNNPNIQQIAERFEISRRQALRDIEYMRNSLGAPLEYCMKRKGYYYTHDSFAVPSHQITETQRDILFSLSAHYEVLGRHDTRTSEAFSELSALLLRLSGRSTLSIPLCYTPEDGVIPFRVLLQPEYAKHGISTTPTSLQPFYRGRNEKNYDIFEFYNSYDFIPALLASGLNYKVVHPKWLKIKLIQYLERMRQFQLG